MKTYFGNHLGIVIDNNDPEHRGRVQVFIPHIMPTLYEDWNKKGADVTLRCVGDNIPEGLTSDIVEKLKKILPWAEAASPIIGQSGPGNVSPGLAGAITAAGVSPVGAIGGDAANQGLPGSGAGSASSSAGENLASAGNNLDQSPTAAPAGALVPGEDLIIPMGPTQSTKKGLKPLFVQRLNAFYREATSLGYTVRCDSARRTYEHQQSLYLADLEKQRKRGIFDGAGNPKPSGFVAPPGYSTHETGIAVDLHIRGPGVKIDLGGKFEPGGSSYGSSPNKDTPAFRQMLAKYGLHQPLHPSTGADPTEMWHIEPIETPAARKTRVINGKTLGRGNEASITVAKLMSKATDNSVAETTSASQFPAGANPLVTSKPQDTGDSTPAPRTS